MKPTLDRSFATDWIISAPGEVCVDCGGRMPRYRAVSRWVQRLDGVYRLVHRDRRCDNEGCPGPRPIIRAPRDLRIVLPGRTYGTDVTLCVGERHLLEGVSLNQITKNLNARKIPIDQRHTGRVFRDFLALAALARGDDATIQARLRAQGGILLMCDGVQFDERSPVLYMVWDAISGTPLFGKRKVFRGEDDLVPILERVRAMEVPLIGVVTDKEKGLVAAIQRVFPDAPYQYCQTHFLKNCAKPLQPDLTALQGSIRRRAEAVRVIGKRLSSPTLAPEPDSEAVAMRPPSTEAAGTHGAPEPQPEPSSDPAPRSESVAPLPDLAHGACESPRATPLAVEPLSEEDLARQVCELVRVNSRVSGKAPLEPPELNRHDRLEKIGALVNEARGKKARKATDRVTGSSSINSRRLSNRPGTKHGPQAASDATRTSYAASRTSCPVTPTGKIVRSRPPKPKHGSTPT